VLHAATGDEVAGIISGLQRIAGTSGHADLIARCIAMLGIFRLSRQIATIDRIIRRLTDASSVCSQPCRAPAR
jgi:tRNA pseudouridine-54 N-methylase